MHAFLNATAGSAKDVEAALVADPSIVVHRIGPEHLAEEIRAAVAAGATRVMVAGGDGTVGLAAAVVAGTPVELAVIPGGTLNHFARSVGIPDDTPTAVRVATGPSVRTVDVGYVNDRLILNTSSVGVYTLFVRTRERYERRFGYRLASLIALIRLLRRLVTLAVELDIEGGLRRYDTPLVFVGVGERELRLPKLGGRVENGRRGLHVMVVRGRARARLLALAFAAAARGTRYLARLPQFDSFLVDHCTVGLRAPGIVIGLDGEIVSMQTPLKYRLARDALRVATP